VAHDKRRKCARVAYDAIVKWQPATAINSLLLKNLSAEWMASGPHRNRPIGCKLFSQNNLSLIGRQHGMTPDRSANIN
jgi:hypothetical protein